MKDISDLNNLYGAYKASKKNSDWKSEVQKYEMNWLSELTELQKELNNKTYRTSKGVEFIINERGKPRFIVGNKMRDRVVRHSFCDNVLLPLIENKLIYDNGASRVGKGLTFSRARLLKHLRNFYHHYGNNGYILLIDFSKYYDNILHDEIRKQFSELNDNQKWLLNIILKDFEVDVSYMSDNEYATCLDRKYNSLESEKSTLGKKYMHKSVNIGDQTSQIISIYYPTRIDNYVKIVRSQKYYGRYMDDSYIISNSIDELKSILEGIKDIARELGIFINERKTRIVKLSQGFRYLQNMYILTNTGRVIVKINPKRLTAMRRKMKKLGKKIQAGILPKSVLEELFRSWICNYYKIMSRQQRINMYSLYNQLIGGLQND